MAGLWLLLPIAVLGGAALAGPPALRRYVKKARRDHSNRPRMWDRFYSFDWGETTTNNYGFAPATSDHPQRFQHQMYRELLTMLKAKRALKPGMKLLEVSCGRGGGLQAFITLAWRRFGKARDDSPPGKMPYGVSIAVAGIAWGMTQLSLP